MLTHFSRGAKNYRPGHQRSIHYKSSAWPTAPASGDGRRKSLETFWKVRNFQNIERSSLERREL